MRFFSILPALCLALLASACPQGQKAAQPGPPSAGAQKPAAAQGQLPEPLKLDHTEGPPVVVVADVALKGALAVLADDFSALHSGGWNTRLLERRELLATGSSTASAAGGSKSPVQVYLVADNESIDELRARGLVDESTLRTFAGDTLAVVGRQGEKWVCGSVYDLAELRFHAFGIGDPEATSVGYYGKQALISDGAYPRIEKRIRTYASSQDLLDALMNVKDRKIREAERGEVQLALIFGSITAQTKGSAAFLAIPRDLHEPIRYIAVAATGHASDPGVTELLRFLAEDPAVQAKLESYGYLSRSKALEDAR